MLLHIEALTFRKVPLVSKMDETLIKLSVMFRYDDNPVLMDC